MKICREQTATIAVDPQRGFSELCPNELPVPKALEIVKELWNMNRAGIVNIVTMDCHPPNAEYFATPEKPMFTKLNAPEMDIVWNAHCVVGTEGNKLLPGLPNVDNYDFVVCKGLFKDMHPYGAAYHDLSGTLTTGLHEFLEANGIETVVVGGLATDYCVKTTALQLRELGYDVIIDLNACRGIAENTTTQAIDEMLNNGIKMIDSIDDLEI
jgi:nicotinamidase/pyrazinamidase